MSSVKVVSSFWCLEFAAIGEGEVSNDGERGHEEGEGEGLDRIGQGKQFMTVQENRTKEKGYGP